MNYRAFPKMLCLALILTALMSCASAPRRMTVPTESTRAEIERHLVVINARDLSVLVSDEPLKTPELVRQFYYRRDYRPAWIYRSRLNKSAKALLKAIRSADEHGLRPASYHLAALDAILSAPDSDNAPQRAARDILLTDAYFTYSSHLAGLPLDSRDGRLMWRRHAEHQDPITRLETGLASRNFTKHIKSLSTQETGYQQLKAALIHYRQIAEAGGWPYVPPGPALRHGNTGDRVAMLRERLERSGDLEKNSGTVFDISVEDAVRRFQQRHGLRLTGRVNHKTLKTLNIPIETRIHQLKVNLQRRRWLPDQLGQRHILVNIPDYHLYFVEGEQAVLKMNVVVGRKTEAWRTPSLVSQFTHLILNPQWNVPRNIFKKELLKEIREDPEYLARNNMMVVPTSTKAKIDTANIDWSEITGDEEIRIVQRSGNGNSLGRVKFMFPNPYAIYLHDTRAKSLFKRHKRAFSHGCVRVAQPLELAEFLLKESSDWSRHEIISAIDGKKNQKVRLPEPINLYVQYWTAWVGENNEIQFREDIYKRDEWLSEILGL